MQEFLLGDAIAAARALMLVPAPRRAWRLRRMLAEARAANAFRLAHGYSHPRWGDGSLMTAALRRGVPDEPPLSDPAYRQSLILVLAMAHDHPFAQERHKGTLGSAASRAGAISSPQSVQ